MSDPWGREGEMGWIPPPPCPTPPVAAGTVFGSTMDRGPWGTSKAPRNGCVRWERGGSISSDGNGWDGRDPRKRMRSKAILHSVGTHPSMHAERIQEACMKKARNAEHPIPSYLSPSKLFIEGCTVTRKGSANFHTFQSGSRSCEHDPGSASILGGIEAFSSRSSPT